MEIMNKGKEKNVCIYKHVRMSNEEFNNNEFMFHILERLHLRNNSFFVWGVLMSIF